MSTLHFRDARIFVDGFELSADFESIEVAFSAEMLDETTFGDSTRIRKGGLTMADVSGSGYWNGAAGAVDRILFDIVGSDNKIITVFANGISEGTSTDKGFSMKGVVSDYNIGGSVGALLPFDFAMSGRGIEA